MKINSDKQRAIELINDNPYGFNKDVVNVPVIGRVAAGTPILAIENYEDSLPLPTTFIKNRECFVLKVQGSSMINAGIFDGDYVIVQVRPVAENGEIVVAMIDDEAKMCIRDRVRAAAFVREADILRSWAAEWFILMF